MKAILTILTLILPCVCIAQGFPTLANKESLQGKVKTIRYSYGGTRGVETEWRALPFDTSDYWLDSFSDAGLKLHTYNIKNGVVIVHTEFRTDAAGSYKVENGVVPERPKLEFDTRGYLIVERWLKTYKVLSYDTNGNLISERQYDQKNNLNEIVKYTHATDGRVVIRDQLYSDGSVHHRTSYRCNEKEQITEIESEFFNTPCPGKTVDEYTYDDRGNRISEIHKGGNNHKLIWKYDQYNNEVLKGDIVTEYIYDSHGNWIRRVRHMPRNDVVAVREIEYY